MSRDELHHDAGTALLVLLAAGALGLWSDVPALYWLVWWPMVLGALVVACVTAPADPSAPKWPRPRS